MAVGGQEIGSYGLGVTPGKLSIRGTTGALTTGSIRAASEASKPIDQITACAEANVEYYVNQSQLAVTDKNKVALLVDNIVDVSYHQTLKALANTVVSRLDHQNRLQFQFQYLDLVDTSMGNAWVTASAPLEVVWPYPDGTDKNDEFTIIHYKGMDRDYNLSEMAGLRLGTDYTLEVYTTGTLGRDTDAVTYHSLTRGDNGMAFTVDSFSPYVLIWEGEEEDPSAGGGSSGGGSSNPPTQPKPEEEPEADNKPDGLNTTEHYAYLMGRGDGGVQPLAPITRGEVATIWFRLLTDETRAHNWSAAHLYPDVAAGSWYHNTIATVTHMDVMHGDTEGTFRPEEEITRAEFVASAVRFFGTPSTESALRFTDVPADAWYADAVYAGAALGLIEGDGDGAFRPEDTITRAEVAAIVNRMLGRKPRGGMLLEQAAPWVDNPKDAWYYADMLEASVGHDYVWLGTGEHQVERWTGLLPARDWMALEQYGPQQKAEDISL